MSGIQKVVSTIAEVFTGGGKHQTSSFPETASSSIRQHQEHLDTSNMVKILVIGETGSGKSTYINYLTNYFSQGSLQNLKVAIPSKFRPCVTEAFSHCEHDIQNTTQSKTDACNQYMFASNGKQYLFLDTPGLSDTRGAEQDDKNIIKIVDSVEKLGGLTAVIIVVNGAVSRLTINLRNVIARLHGNLPDIVMSNVILVLTNATRHAATFSIPALELNGNVYPYYMQNSAFSQDPSTWTASALEALHYDWDQAMNEIAAMIQTIDTFKTKSVTAFKQMKDIRNEIKTQMHAARLEVSKIQKMQDEIAAFDAVLQQSNKDLITYKDYTKGREVDKVEIIDAPFHSTLCQNCNHVCHPKCKLDETTAVGAQIFQQCWAISNGNCRQCQHKCSYTAHYHAKKTVKKSKEKLQDVLAEIKVKFDQAANDKSDYQNKITSTADAKKLLENALLQKKEEIKQLCLQLRNICAGFNIAQELHALVDQLEIESAMLKNIEAKQQANAFIRSLKEFCNMLEKDQDLNQNKSVQMNIIKTERSIQGQVHLLRASPANNASLVTQQSNNVNTALNRSPDTDSYANDDVLQAIRAISRKKVKSRENKKSKGTRRKPVSISESETEEEEKESDTATNEDSDEEYSGKEVKKRREKKNNKNQPIPIPPASETIDVNQFKNLTIDELLAQYHACIDQRMRNFIIHEMMERSHGKSVGPLKSPESMVEFTASSQKYCVLGGDALRQAYQRLKSQITAITEPDILKIHQVSPALLLEIAAVYILLQRAPPDEPPVNNINDHNRFANHSRNDQINNGMHLQSKPVSDLQFNQSRYLFGSPQQRQQYPSNHNERQNTPTHANDPPAYDDRNRYPHYSPYEQQQQQSAQFVHNSTFFPSSSSSHIETTFDNMHISTDHHNSVSLPNNHPLPSTINDVNASMPDKSPSTSFQNVGNSGNSEEVRRMKNIQLLAAYNDAYSKRDHAMSNILYNELQRRCYGDHPLLMHEKKLLFDKICKKYQGRSLNELKQLQMHIHQKIRGCLTNDDATHINDVPSEFIVDAGVLAHIIATTTSHS